MPIKKHLYIAIISFLLFNSCLDDDENYFDFTPINTSEIKVINEIKTLGGTSNESAQEVISTNDGGYAILGFTQSSDGDITDKTNKSFNFWLLKYSPEGILEWQKNYGGLNDDRGFGLVQTPDGGYALLGHNTSSDGDATVNAGNTDLWVIKVNATGSILWQKSHGYIGSDYGAKIINTSDNGLLLTGVIDVTSSEGAGNDRKNHAGGDYWAIKLNSNGDKLWRRYYGGTLSEITGSVIETKEGDFVISGTSDSPDVDISNNKGTYDIWVVKINSTGTILWEKNFGGSQIDNGFGVTHTTDGNYLILGDTRSSDKDVAFNNGSADIWALKIDPNGNIIWKKTIGGSSFDVGRSVCQAKEGGFYIAGSSRSVDGNITTNKGQNDALILKISNEGNLEWQKTFGGNGIDFLYGITQLPNGNIIAVGDSGSKSADITENKGFTDLLIINLK